MRTEERKVRYYQFYEVGEMTVIIIKVYTK